jgi:hypothetical protein
MGGRASRLDRFYTNYEKSFERLEQEVQRLKVEEQSEGDMKHGCTTVAAGYVDVAT